MGTQIGSDTLLNEAPYRYHYLSRTYLEILG